MKSWWIGLSSAICILYFAGRCGDVDSAGELLRWVLIISCVGSGMMAGLFVSFSTFMMKALGSLDRSEGMRAMQAINRLIVRPSFLLIFIGTAVFSTISAFLSYDCVDPWRYICLSAAIYTVGCLLSTIAFNIPLNNQLDNADSSIDEGHALWDRYLVQWTHWNHLRSFATLVSTVLLAFALSES